MPISNEAFAKKMMKALRRSGFDGEMQYDAERFAIVSKERGEFFLHSAHQFYTQASFWKRVFVANYAPMRRKSGEVYSCCSWAPCVSLLPRTDEIAIFDADAQLDKGAQPVMVAWDDAIRVVGHRMKRDERFQMERYLVEQSPTVDEMAELRKRASMPPSGSSA